SAGWPERCPNWSIRAKRAEPEVASNWPRDGRSSELQRLLRVSRTRGSEPGGLEVIGFDFHRPAQPSLAVPGFARLAADAPGGATVPTLPLWRSASSGAVRSGGGFRGHARAGRVASGMAGCRPGLGRASAPEAGYSAPEAQRVESLIGELKQVYLQA